VVKFLFLVQPEAFPVLTMSRPPVGPIQPSSQSESAYGLKLISHFHVVLRLTTMCPAIPWLPHTSLLCKA